LAKVLSRYRFYRRNGTPENGTTTWAIG